MRKSSRVTCVSAGSRSKSVRAAGEGVEVRSENDSPPAGFEPRRRSSRPLSERVGKQVMPVWYEAKYPTFSSSRRRPVTLSLVEAEAEVREESEEGGGAGTEAESGRARVEEPCEGVYVRSVVWRMVMEEGTNEVERSEGGSMASETAGEANSILRVRLRSQLSLEKTARSA